MSSIPVRSLRLLPKSKAELDRISGNKGEIFYDSTSKSLRVFDGSILGGTLLNASVAVADNPPDTPTQGSLWFNSANGSLYIYYEDINSQQWITPIVPAGLIGSGGGTTNGANTTLSNLGTTAINASLLPNVSSAIDLGSSSKRWKDIYLSGSTIYLGNATITSTGSVVDLPAGSTVGGSSIGGSGVTSINDLSDVDTVTAAPSNGQALVWNSVASNWRPGTISGGGVSSNSFSTITVAGQSDVVADSTTDILTLVSGTGITITTTPGSDTITFTNSGIPNSFATIAVTGQSNVVADSSSDTLTLAAGTGITITTNATTDTITVASGFNQSLNTTDDVVFDTVTATTLTSNGVGTPTYTSSSDFIFNTGGGVGAIIVSGDIEVTGSATFGNIGAVNGIASLGADGKLSASQIPSSLSGAIVFKGTWDASTNTPTLANGSGTAGWEYAVSVGGTINLGSGSITFTVGDYVIYNGAAWERIPSSTIAAAGTLTGTTLASNVVSSSLTSVGTLTNLTVTNTIVGSINGNAATVTNGVYTSGSYSNPAWITALAGSKVTDAVLTTGSYSNPTWISSLAASKVGLGNVTNESKATMFTSPTFTGTVELTEILTSNSTVSISSGFITGGSPPNNRSSIYLDSAGFNNYIAASNYGHRFFQGNTQVFTVPSTAGTTGQVLTTDGAGSSSWTTVSGGGIPTYPAITALDVTANGFTAYLFYNQYGSTNNPTIYAISGTTIAFNLNVSSPQHPFLIRTPGGAMSYDFGLIHVASDGTVSTGANAQGKTSGTLYWQIPANISGNYQYICSFHPAMVGVISIKDISTI